VNPTDLAAAVKRAALDVGFDACGITDLSPSAAAQALDDWLAAGYHGAMAYMQRQAATRREPIRAWPLAKSAVVVLHNYYTSNNYTDGRAKVARYAQGFDYHTVTRDMLRLIAGAVSGLVGGGSFKYYVDAGPLPERELARRAGLGWIGKNTMLIHPRQGSFSFIGVLLTDLELAPDAPFEADHCGSCTACLDACPTDAFPAPRVLDATRCISYLTIESRSEIPDMLRAAVGDNLFGCDICQDVCPWNVKFAQPAREPRFMAPEPDTRPSLPELAELSDEDFRRHFGHTAMERAGAAGLRRNARVVLENQSARA
jgi:epoxyqueuosine reductase